MTERGLALALLLGCAAIGTAAACAAWPLSVYAFTLAAFGAPHALVELQWVGRRYGARRSLALRVLPVLLGIALLRLLALPFGFASGTSASVELALGAALVPCVVLPTRGEGERRAGSWLVLAGAVGMVLLVVAVAIAPVDAMLVLAIAHNVTPIGLVADRLRDGDATVATRMGFALAGLVVFVLVPLALATGLAAHVLGLATTDSTSSDLAAANGLGLGLQDGIAAFRPSFVSAACAVDLLRTAAFLQVVHYVAVLVVLPRLGPVPVRERAAFSPAVRRAFVGVVVGLALVFAAGFALDFREARAGYGVLAAVHVWLELPALLLALTPRPVARLA